MGIPFVGANFTVQTAVQRGLTGIRVRFTHDPLAVASSGSHDALNPAQYSLSGPTAGNYVTHAATVPDDPQSIDLTTAGPLGAGTWTLAVSSNLQTADAHVLAVPRSAFFLVVASGSTEGVDGGARDDSAESTIRKHLPLSLAGRAWDALIAALAVGDRLNWDNARLAFDQLFKSSASGLYLDRKASDDGLARPPDIGMPDDLFRKLAIKTGAAKLTQEVLLEIMEVFYGLDAVRASISTDLSEPFPLSDGQTLDLFLNERDPVTVIFREADFLRITQAQAQEVAASITEDLARFKNKGFAVAFADPLTGLQKVRVYSGSLGLGSALRVTGGSAQQGLQFPARLSTYPGTVALADNYTWVVTNPDAGLNVISLTKAVAGNKVDLTTVRPGDYVIFQAAQSTIPTGVYPILDVSVSGSGANLIQTFSIAQNLGAHSFTQLSNQELIFFRPERQGLQDSSRAVILAQTQPGVLDVRIPATTQAVGRGVRTAAYPHDSRRLTVASMVRTGTTVVVTTSSPHGLVVGNQVSVEEALGGGLNGIQAVTSTPGATEFHYKTPNYSANSTNWNPDVVVRSMAALPAGASVGPFSLDPLGGVAVTAVETQTTEDLRATQQYGVLNVVDASGFPDQEGWLVIGFGRDTEVAPVKYLGKFSPTALILDYGYRFPATNLSGATVTLLEQKGLFSPESPEDVGALYVTSSSAGRVAALKALGDSVAAGLTVNLEVVYPGDRGLGGEGLPVTGQRLSDKVIVWGGDHLSEELATARGESLR